MEPAEERIAHIERLANGRQGAIFNDMVWLIAELRATQQALAQARAALEFYADQDRWRANSYGIISAHEDRGERAREALRTAPATDKEK